MESIFWTTNMPQDANTEETRGTREEENNTARNSIRAQQTAEIFKSMGEVSRSGSFY